MNMYIQVLHILTGSHRSDRGGRGPFVHSRIIIIMHNKYTVYPNNTRKGGWLVTAYKTTQRSAS